MELMIIKLGFIKLIVFWIVFKFVFVYIYKLFFEICKCFVCSFVCLIDFFFDIYNIFLFVSVSWVEICSNKVDFLILGFLLISIIDFGIIFLLRILFNFGILVLICFFVLFVIWVIGVVFEGFFVWLKVECDFFDGFKVFIIWFYLL